MSINPVGINKVNASFDFVSRGDVVRSSVASVATDPPLCCAWHVSSFILESAVEKTLHIAFTSQVYSWDCSSNRLSPWQMHTGFAHALFSKGSLFSWLANTASLISSFIMLVTHPLKCVLTLDTTLDRGSVEMSYSCLAANRGWVWGSGRSAGSKCHFCTSPAVLSAATP